MTFGEVCRSYTLLPDEDIAFLEGIADSMPYSADLTASDVFLDCMGKDGVSVIVASHARPRWKASLYKGSVVGESASRENEPAVYHAFETGVPVHDLKAITQEGRAVRQDVVPVQNAKGETVAVMIREKDVSERLQKEKKFDFLASEREKSAPFADPGAQYETALREAHHRIKNNLQLIVSIMRMQGRNSENPEVKQAFEVNTRRVLTIASIHDILTKTDISETAELKALFTRIARETEALYEGSRRVAITVTGDSLEVSAEMATSAAIVVNELVTNAALHGFDATDGGTIKVSVQKGNKFATVTVEDDGKGFDTGTAKPKSMGLAIVALMVKDKLHGEFRIKSDENGTKAAFEFANK